MKVYKLIKEYPNCGYKLGKSIETDIIWINNQKAYLKDYPEFWQEVIEYPIGTKVHNSLTNNIYTKKEDGWYRPAEKTAYTDEMIGSRKHLTVLGNSEEVVEKDYEILSVKSVPLGSIWTCVKNSTFGISYKGDVFYCSGGAIRGFQVLEDLNKGRYSIYSVKRISDGEVFTVGDLCNPIREYSYNKHKITIIEFCKSGYLRIGSRNYYIGINNIEHSKKPLFTTDDGVDIS